VERICVIAYAYHRAKRQSIDPTLIKDVLIDRNQYINILQQAVFQLVISTDRLLHVGRTAPGNHQKTQPATKGT
jgi:hypothetical protein